MIAFVGGLWLTIFSGLIAAIMHRLTWLQYLYYLSYIKVGTTPIKYTPQVGMYLLVCNVKTNLSFTQSAW